ncbi:MAG: SPOR domain-containing protein [Candidatus Wallbacteria bacterium]|nr:SPOR domain-containing protein [Candidatus Wallbacteria bacterium]
MNLQNTPWDYQEHDRIISILAWVVVVVLVIYASVFFYKQITTAPERPVHETPAAPVATAPGDESQGTAGGEAKNPEPPQTVAPVTVAKLEPTPHPPPQPAFRMPPVVTATPPPPPVTRPAAPPPAPVVAAPPPAPPVAVPVAPPAVAVHPAPPAPPRPRSERMTLKIGKFASAGEAVRTGVELGIDGHSFTPVRDPLTNRYTLHFGEFTGWKDAIEVMEAIKGKNSALDVVVWPIPSSADGPSGSEDFASPRPAPGSPPTAPAPGKTAPHGVAPATAQRPAGALPSRPAAAAASAQRPLAPAKPAPARPAAARAASTDSAQPQDSAEPLHPAAPAGPFVVRVASYKVAGNAQTTVRALAKSGFRATMDRTSVRGEPWFRVHVGGFQSADEARRAIPKIERSSGVRTGAVVVKL